MRYPTTDVTDIGNRPGDGPLRAGGRPMPADGVSTAKDLPSTPCPAYVRQAPGLPIICPLYTTD
ncbi:hypothetical protein, partial [Escherichia coli]|uniref:hypothetical protein n=1 Tax=Escherichia coli TaxID=562 RepID=UPI001BDB75A8